MEQESKALSELGLFGLISLCILVFCSLSFCLCFTIHVRWIWSVICPLLSIVNCVSSCLNKFRIRHKDKPQNLSDVEGRILNSKSARKVGRRTGQSVLLKDLQSISPRLKDFFTDIEVQEREDFYRRSCGQNSAAELKRQNFGLAQTRFVEIHESEFKDFTNKNSRHTESLFSQGQRERSAQKNCRLGNSQPAIVRVNSTGALDKPLPRTTLVQKVDHSSSDY